MEEALLIMTSVQLTEAVGKENCYTNRSTKRIVWESTTNSNKEQVNTQDELKDRHIVVDQARNCLYIYTLAQVYMSLFEPPLF